MFTYCYIDNLGIRTPASFAFNKDLESLKKRVEDGQYQELIIIQVIF